MYGSIDYSRLGWLVFGVFCWCCCCACVFVCVSVFLKDDAIIWAMSHIEYNFSNAHARIYTSTMYDESIPFITNMFQSLCVFPHFEYIYIFPEWNWFRVDKLGAVSLPFSWSAVCYFRFLIGLYVVVVIAVAFFFFSLSLCCYFVHIRLICVHLVRLQFRSVEHKTLFGVNDI